MCSLPVSVAFVLRKNHLDIFRWLFERIESFACEDPTARRLQWAKDAMKAVVHRGDLELLKHVYPIEHRRASKKAPANILNLIVFDGHVEKLEYLLEVSPPFKLCDAMMNTAADGGHLAMVQFLHGKGLIGTEDAMTLQLAMGISRFSNGFTPTCDGWSSLCRSARHDGCTPTAEKYAQHGRVGFLSIVAA